MRQLAAILLFASLIPAQYEEEPPDDASEVGACSGCGMNLAGSLPGASGEQWQFIPAYYNRPGKCYDRFDHKGCSTLSCSFDGKLQFSFFSILPGTGGARKWVINGKEGIVTRGQKSGWIKYKMRVACGEINPPKGLAFDIYTTGKQTSGFAFRCEQCYFSKFSTMDR